MLRSARKHLRSVAMLGVAGALVVGGVAVAQNNDSGSGNQNGKSAQGKGEHRRGGPGGPGGRHGGPPGPGVPMKAVTYAEFHVQTKEGDSKVIRLDQGTITAVSDSSITVKEKDDSSVTVDVNDATKVRGPGLESVGDLEEGQAVVVKSVDGGAAKSISALPEKGAGKGPKGGSGKGQKGGPGNGPMEGERKGDGSGPSSGRMG
jgi:hypothetical protein